MNDFVPNFYLDGEEVDPAQVPADRLYDVTVTTPDGPVRLYRFISRDDGGDARVPAAPAT